MTYEASVQFKFDATWTPSPRTGFGATLEDDSIPEQLFVVSAPAADLNCRQYFKLFERFMLGIGMTPSNIHDGAMSLVFNEWVREADQREICKEYEITMNEDLHEKFKEWKQIGDKLPENIRHSQTANDES